MSSALKRAASRTHAGQYADTVAAEVCALVVDRGDIRPAHLLAAQRDVDTEATLDERIVSRQQVRDTRRKRRVDLRIGWARVAGREPAAVGPPAGCLQAATLALLVLNIRYVDHSYRR